MGGWVKYSVGRGKVGDIAWGGWAVFYYPIKEKKVENVLNNKIHNTKYMFATLIPSLTLNKPNYLLWKDRNLSLDHRVFYQLLQPSDHM
jgi:hypothetical protein